MAAHRSDRLKKSTGNGAGRDLGKRRRQQKVEAAAHRGVERHSERLARQTREQINARNNTIDPEMLRRVEDYIKASTADRRGIHSRLDRIETDLGDVRSELPLLECQIENLDDQIDEIREEQRLINRRLRSYLKHQLDESDQDEETLDESDQDEEALYESDQDEDALYESDQDEEALDQSVFSESSSDSMGGHLSYDRFRQVS